MMPSVMSRRSKMVAFLFTGIVVGLVLIAVWSRGENTKFIQVRFPAFHVRKKSNVRSRQYSRIAF